MTTAGRKYKNIRFSFLLMLLAIFLYACQTRTVIELSPGNRPAIEYNKETNHQVLTEQILYVSPGNIPSRVPEALPTATITPNVKPASLQILTLEVNELRITVGQDVMVQLMVKNAGEATGDFAIPLLMDDVQTATFTAELLGDQTSILSINLKVMEDGIKELRVGSLTTRINVLKPALFTVSKLKLSKTVVAPGEETEVIVTVKNIGEVAGDYSNRFVIDGGTSIPVGATLIPGEIINFSGRIVKYQPGKYKIAFDNDNAELQVLKPPSFVLGQLALSKQEVLVGEQFTVNIDVTNEGELSGEYIGSFHIEGDKPTPVTASIKPGETKRLAYTIYKTNSGYYKILFANKHAEFRVLRQGPFTVDIFQLSKSTVAIGEEVRIFVDVTNKGDVSGEYSDKIEIVGQDSIPIKGIIYPQTTTRFTIPFSRNAAGTYKLNLSNQQVALNVSNELTYSRLIQYQNIDLHEIKSRPLSWQGKPVMVSGIVQNTKFYPDTNENRIDFKADLPFTLYETARVVARVPGKIDWLVPGIRLKLFGKVAGMEQASNNEGSDISGVPSIAVDHVLIMKSSEQAGSTRLNPIGMGKSLSMVLTDGRIIGVTFEQSAQGIGALMVMQNLNISTSQLRMGNQFYLFLARVEFFLRPIDEPLNGSDYSFALVSSDGLVLDTAVLVPEQGTTSPNLNKYWTVMQGPADEEFPVVRFSYGDGREGWMATVAK